MIEKIITVFGTFAGAPADLGAECDRWRQTFTGHEDRLRALMLRLRMEGRWVPLEEAAAALGVEVATEGQGVGPIGPMVQQWAEGSCRWPCGPREAQVRATQRRVLIARGVRLTEDQACEWTRALSTARVADGHPPHRLVGPARYEVEQAHREAWALARSRGRDALSREEERAFAAYLRDADRKDAAAGWEVPLSPTAQAQAEEEGDAGLPALARRFVGR